MARLPDLANAMGTELLDLIGTKSEQFGMGRRDCLAIVIDPGASGRLRPSLLPAAVSLRASHARIAPPHWATRVAAVISLISKVLF
jgi:hypothetical protein